MQQVFAAIQMLARSDVTVLLLGESGTGKEMAAHAIHALSQRKAREMVVVNCPALPENILESELFGYRKGAFTNAAQDKKGLFEEAEGSTILLDEIGDLSLTLQTKLLRVLQEKEIKPLGSTHTRRVDVRIIASTNRDLVARLKEGTLREDLYYRLNVASLTLPPLRERREDLPLLIEHFLAKAAEELRVPAKSLGPEARENLMRRHWAGNIRELENVIRGLTALAPQEQIGVAHLAGEEPLSADLPWGSGSVAALQNPQGSGLTQIHHQICDRASGRNRRQRHPGGPGQRHPAPVPSKNFQTLQHIPGSFSLPLLILDDIVKIPEIVTPTKVGVHNQLKLMGHRLRGNDEKNTSATFYERINLWYIQKSDISSCHCLL